MARHFILLDPIEKLTITKDSTLMLALTLKNMGHECWLIFEQDFAICTSSLVRLKSYRFDGGFKEDSSYLNSFELIDSEVLQVCPGDIFHMRLDPPFDSRYLRYLWMLGALEKQGVRVLNSPRGVVQFNEKIHAFEHPSAVESFIGSGEHALKSFLDQIKGDVFIIKPLDLYQGIGVSKVSRKNVLEEFKESVKKYGGSLVVQPYLKEVEQGEVRSVYFKGQEIGNILKVPPKGEFLANIAQGAEFSRYELSMGERKACEEVSRELMNYGVDWVAFDILGGHLSEVNITCPGLLVEVSHAYKRNLAEDIVKLIV